MATLYGECLVSFQKIMHDNMDSFTRKGFDLKFYNTKKEYSGGFSGLESSDIARQRFQEYHSKSPEELNYGIIRDNMSRREKIVPANFVLGSSDFSACIEDTLRRIASLYPESTTAELYANMGAVPDEKIPEGEEDNWVPVDLGYSIPEILRIENSPKPPLYFKVNPHYEDTLAFKMPYFDMDYLEKHVRPEFDEISEIIPISPEDYQKSIKYEDVCTSARN